MILERVKVKRMNKWIMVGISKVGIISSVDIYVSEEEEGEQVKSVGLYWEVREERIGEGKQR